MLLLLSDWMARDPGRLGPYLDVCVKLSRDAGEPGAGVWAR